MSLLIRVIVLLTAGRISQSLITSRRLGPISVTAWRSGPRRLPSYRSRFSSNHFLSRGLPRSFRKRKVSAEKCFMKKPSGFSLPEVQALRDKSSYAVPSISEALETPAPLTKSCPRECKMDSRAETNATMSFRSTSPMWDTLKIFPLA